MRTAYSTVTTDSLGVVLINHFPPPKKEVKSSPKYFNFVCFFFGVCTFFPLRISSWNRSLRISNDYCPRAAYSFRELDCIFLVDDWDSVEAAGFRYLMSGTERPPFLHSTRERENNGHYRVHDTEKCFTTSLNQLYTQIHSRIAYSYRRAYESFLCFYRSYMQR